MLRPFLKERLAEIARQALGVVVEGANDDAPQLPLDVADLQLQRPQRLRGEVVVGP